MVGQHVATVPRPGEHGEPASLEFPGCRPVRISREEITDCDRRIEYWDGTTEISAALPRRLTELEGVSIAALVQAALECRDEEHLLRLVSDRR